MVHIKGNSGEGRVFRRGGGIALKLSYRITQQMLQCLVEYEPKRDHILQVCK